jgi:hypothetical protein
VTATIQLVIPKEAFQPTPPPKQPSALELVVQLVKAAAWPVLALVVILSIRAPLIRSANLLPKMLEQSTSAKVSAGGLSIEIQRAATAAGIPQLGELIRGLSPEAVELLLDTGKRRQGYVGSSREREYTFPSAADKKVLLELKEKGLLAFEMPFEEYEAFVSHLALEPAPGSWGERVGLRATRPLTEEEVRKLRQQTYFLTDRGKKAYDLVLDAVKRELRAS